MTLSVATARSVGTRPMEVVNGMIVLTVYFDVCSEVDRPDAAEGHRGVVPRCSGCRSLTARSAG